MPVKWRVNGSTKLSKETRMINENLTSKTIRLSDKVKVARVIADMLGVEKVESMSPEMAINQAFRKIKTKRMTPEFIGVIRKMIDLAGDVGVKVDPSLIPRQVSEQNDTEVDKKSSYNMAKGILKFKDYAELVKLNKGIVPVGKGFSQAAPTTLGHAAEQDLDTSQPQTEVGSSLHDPADDQVRRRKVKYKTEDVASADYKINPETGRKYRARRIDFANSGAKGRLQHDDEKEVQEQTAESDPGANREKVEKAANKANLILRHAKEREALATRHDTQKKAMEEVEHLDELSNDTLQSYKKKASADASAADQSGDTERANKRFSGVVKATNKQFDNDKVSRKNKDATIVFGDGEDKSKMNEEADLSDDELEKMAAGVDHEDDILDVYDEDELTIIDQDTGEEVEDEDIDEVNEQALNEVLSRIERMKSKIRFLRTKAKRARRLQIALKRRSDVKTLSKRARRLAIRMLKQRFAKKPVSQMSVAEKERVEKMLQSRKVLIDRLAMRLLPRVRKIESDRLSHSKSKQPTPSTGV